MDLISVIVPVYNVEKYLKKCVDSIINQTYKNLEIWLVDDGSPDGCPVICDDYAQKDSRIKVIHKKNGGLSDARNAALDKMTGEYVTFVDSDDYLALDAIETMYNALKNNDAQIAVGNMKYYTDDGSAGYQFSPFEKETVLCGNDKLLLINQPSAPNKLYCSVLYHGIRFPFEKLYEDLHVWHNILQNTDKIVMTGKTAYYYFIRRNSIMQSSFKISSTHRFEPLSERAEWLDSLGRNDLATENRMFIYSDFADAVAHKKVFTGVNKQRFKEIQVIYNKCFTELKNSENIRLKQKVRLYILRYFPYLHTVLYKKRG